MSKELALLLAGRDLAQARPSVYRGSNDGSIDGWILMMRRYLKPIQSKAPLWSIIGHLEEEARNYVIDKAESERDDPEKVFEPNPRQCLKNWLPCWQAETWRKLDLAYIEVRGMGPLTDGFW